MGISQGGKKNASRKKRNGEKGKKAWRKISSEEIDDFNEKATRDALSGGALDDLPSDTLFYVDKSTDVSLKRKVEKPREKVLHHESVLQKNPFVKVVPSSTTKKNAQRTQKINMAASENTTEANVDSNKNKPEIFDLWADEGEGDNNGRKKAKPSAIPAVEVEPSGCSFNPDPESHKDTLARAVADEMKKIYQSELAPQPIPLTVPGEPITDEDRYFIDAGGLSEDEFEEEDCVKDGDDLADKRPKKMKRVTRVKLNRRARRKEQQKAEAEAKKKGQLSKEIDSLADIMQEIAEEDEAKENRHLRRVIAKQERLKSCPPRLGKRKFEPAPFQVLLSEEISGSLRKLKGCNTLARDRFKSLEKRGLVVPTGKRKRAR